MTEVFYEQKYTALNMDIYSLISLDHHARRRLQTVLDYKANIELCVTVEKNSATIISIMRVTKPELQISNHDSGYNRTSLQVQIERVNTCL
jgi:hypothetical protein